MTPFSVSKNDDLYNDILVFLKEKMCVLQKASIVFGISMDIAAKHRKCTDENRSLTLGLEEVIHSMKFMSDYKPWSEILQSFIRVLVGS